MPRQPRIVFDGIPHHITQRGNRREDVFFTEKDRQVYLLWLKEYCNKHQIKILAYCLMTNHVHLILLPEKGESISKALKPLHMRYAQRVNKIKNWSGHIWQGRFFSSPLDEKYLMSAVAYVESNPVRAAMVDQAEDYPWSSAASHCDLQYSDILSKLPDYFPAKQNWSHWLKTQNIQHIEELRCNVVKGLPCGSDSFIKALEKLVGRSLRLRLQGRPQKEKG